MKTDCSALAVTWEASPNHGARRGDAPINMLVLHYTGMVSGAAALARLCSPDSEVSAHYLVDEAGAIVQSVPEARRAWHAGRACWHGETDINSCSIGIEIVNPGHEFDYPEFPDAQVAAVIALCKEIVGRHAIPPHRVLAHSDVAPGRKIDPGEKFPWARLAGEGIGLWVAPAPIRGGRFFQEGDRGEPVRALQAMLASYGYDIDGSAVFGTKTRQAVAAFQRHFRPAKVDGVADVSTIETLHRLLGEVSAA